MHCSLCNATVVNPLFFFPAGIVFDCKHCSIVFSQPVESTNSLYDRAYFNTHYDLIIEAQRKTSTQLLEKIKSFHSVGSLLDMGCGTGVFLEEAANVGFSENVGVDVSDYAVSEARERVGDSAEIVPAKAAVLGERRFDVLTYIDSFAHIPQVIDQFESLLKNNLKPGALVLIRTPNFNRAIVWYAKLLSWFVPKKYLQALFFVPNRLLLFNSCAMKEFIKQHSLELLELSVTADYARSSRADSFLARAADFILNRVPRCINPNNSMLVIARVRST